MTLEPPFTVAEILAVFASYNAAIWPLQIIAFGLGALVLIALRLCGPLASKIILAVLAVRWAVNGIG